MIYIALNAFAILAATIGALAFGAAYYAVFDRTARRGAALLATAFLAELWLCAILAGALILAPVKAGGWTVALGTAVIIWVGFVMPALVATHRLRAEDARATLVDCGHWLGAMLVMAAALHAAGLRRP